MINLIIHHKSIRKVFQDQYHQLTGNFVKKMKVQQHHKKIILVMHQVSFTKNQSKSQQIHEYLLQMISK
jgi:hypothetical protein